MSGAADRARQVDQTTTRLHIDPQIPARPARCHSERVLRPARLATAVLVLLAGCDGPGRPADPPGMVFIPGGTFEMGASGEPAPGSLPVHRVTLSPFWIDRTEVKNADFARFVAETGHLTVAERPPAPEAFPGVAKDELVAGSICFHAPPRRVPLDNPMAWWTYRAGADWRHPEGPSSGIAGRERHPVVHVAWTDARAYCAWAGKRLPTEAEWERAARGGLVGKRFAWGDERRPDGRWQANTFQGSFPDHDAGDDRFSGTAPVGSFPPNGFGLFDMSGNVWEWCADYFRPDYYAVSPARDPKGPPDSFDPEEPGAVKRVLRGGSFLCSDDYCLRYTVAARNKGAEDTGSSHVGLRCARSASDLD
jgi:formylglycine-generating enzyme